MKFLKIIIQIALLYGIAWIGSWIGQTLSIPIPGSIIGLLLLFVLLLCKLIPVTWIKAGSNTLMFYLPLFFIPATVGVMNHLELFAGKGLWLIAIVMVSTAITIAAAGHVSQWLAGRHTPEDDSEPDTVHPNRVSAGQSAESLKKEVRL